MIIRQTRTWVEQFVIGLQLCPFAAVPARENRIRYIVSTATTPEDLIEDLYDELELLMSTPPEELETTLLIHPEALTDFDAYLDFLDAGEDMVAEADLEGIIQLAGFHPDYVFADEAEDDPAHFSNRSPYPMIHLLREDSVSLAVDTHPDIDRVPERNVAYLRALGLEEVRSRRARAFVDRQSEHD
ncbi:MAG: DUF1415 domain-containing protein [Bacteroidia bacterium]|nr:DUF1415 domain-containing protein [Bacteroidia bacterium]